MWRNLALSTDQSVGHSYIGPLNQRPALADARFCLSATTCDVLTLRFVDRRSRQAGAARHAFRSDPHLCLKLRQSVAVAAPIEQVVDPDLHHLDVAVALGESVARKEWGASRNSKCSIVEPQIVILDLRRPVRRKSPLDARP